MLIRHTICRFLEERGFQVESATNGREALEVVKRSSPAIIITDLQMPLMTGNELIAALKTNRDTAAIPIVILAARRSTCDPQAESHAQSVIYKDIDIEQQLDKAISALN
jgi:CheY-like chemotaxis protein